MPRSQMFLPVTDNETKKTYYMPWKDPTTKPQDYEVEKFIYDQENPGWFSSVNETLFKPMSDVMSRTIKKRVSEPLLKYSEGEKLEMMGRQMGPSIKESAEPGSWKRSYQDMDRTAARYLGGFAESVGEQLDPFLSPGGVALAAAPYAGKGLQAVGGANMVGKIGTGLTYANKAYGGASAAHGAYGMVDAVSNPSGRGLLEDIKGPAMETALGTLGAFSKRPQYEKRPPKPVPAGRPIIGTDFTHIGEVLPDQAPKQLGPARSFGSRTFYGDEAGNVGENLSGFGKRDKFGRPIFDGPVYEGSVVERPGLPEYVPEPPEQPLPDLKTGPLGGPFRTSSRGSGPVGAMMRDAKAPKTSPNNPLNRFDLTPEGLAREAKIAASEKRVQAEIDAENASLGWDEPVKKTRPKSAGVPSEDIIAAENLRDPSSRARANYKKKIIDQIDVDTVTDKNKQAGLSDKKLKTLNDRLRKTPRLRKLVFNLGEKALDFADDLFSGRGISGGIGGERGSATTSFAMGGGLAETAGEAIYRGGQAAGRGIGKAAAKVGEKAKGYRTKALDNIAAAEDAGILGKARRALGAATGPDVTNASFGGLISSGWAELEKMGEPGVKISRMLKRGRADVEQAMAAATKAGKPMVDEKGVPINRSGGVVYNHLKDELDKLVESMPNPEHQVKAKAIIKEYAGHNKDTKSAFSGGLDSIRSIQALTKLSQFVIGNTAGMGTTLMRNKVGHVLDATKRVIRDFDGALAEAKESGMLDKLSTVIDNESGKGGLSKIVNKIYGVEASEQRLRTISTLAGKATVQDLFEKLKKNPKLKDSRLYKQLDDLVLEDFDTLIKQDKLTPEQIKRAGFRMNELTQGIAESIDLPALWTGHPVMDVLTQFKKYSFMQTRNMKEAFKANPVRMMAVLATVFPVLGEAIGDAKAVVKGGIKGAIDSDKDITDAMWEEVKGRGNPKGDRYFQNLGQAWALGLLGDALKGAERGPMGIAEVLGGPTIGDVSEAGYGAYKYATEGQGYHLGRQAARTIPFIGTGVASTIKGSYKGRQQRRKREKRPARE